MFLRSITWQYMWRECYNTFTVCLAHWLWVYSSVARINNRAKKKKFLNHTHRIARMRLKLICDSLFHEIHKKIPLKGDTGHTWRYCNTRATLGMGKQASNSIPIYKNWAIKLERTVYLHPQVYKTCWSPSLTEARDHLWGWGLRRIQRFCSCVQCFNHEKGWSLQSLKALERACFNGVDLTFPTGNVTGSGRPTWSNSQLLRHDSRVT